MKEKNSKARQKAGNLVRLILLEGPFQDVHETIEKASYGVDFLAKTETGLRFGIKVKDSRQTSPQKYECPRGYGPVYMFTINAKTNTAKYTRAEFDTPLGTVRFQSSASPPGRLILDSLQALLHDIASYHATHDLSDELLESTYLFSSETDPTTKEDSSQEPFELTLLRSSIPIRGYPSEATARSGALPTGHASSCLVRYRGKLVLLTVRHAIAHGLWALEIEADYHAIPPRTKLEPLSGIVSLFLLDLLAADRQEVIKTIEGEFPDRISEIEFAFKVIENELIEIHPKLQLILEKTEAGLEIAEAPRLVINTTLESEPTKIVLYGFAGVTQPKHHKLIQTTAIEFTTKCVTDLRFVSRVGDYGYKFRSESPDQLFDESFKGCSGAPIIGTDGKLVSLVVSGSGKNLFGINLKSVKEAVDAELDKQHSDS